MSEGRETGGANVERLIANLCCVPWFDICAPDLPDTPICNECKVKISAATELRTLRADNEGWKDASESRDALVRKIDVILHGEDGAAKQASLCDLVGPIRTLRADKARLENELVVARGNHRLNVAIGNKRIADLKATNEGWRGIGHE